MGWVIAALVLTGLAILPLGIRVRYDEDGLLAKLVIGPIHKTVYPAHRQKGERKGAEQSKTQEKKAQPEPEQPERKVDRIQQYYPLIKVGMDFLNHLRRKLLVKQLEGKVILAGGDPCDLALSYGRTWAALGNLMPQLERYFRIKKRNIEVECDFMGNQTSYFAYLDLRITLGRLLHLFLRYGIQVIREYMKLNNLRKGGAQV